jgi:hypothetical protein
MRIEDVPPVSPFRLARGRALRPLAPGYSWCMRCKTPWKFTKAHYTPYTEDRSCFPLCETCWQELTPEQRVPYYEKLVKWWYALDPCCTSGGEAEAIIGAALAGK